MSPYVRTVKTSSGATAVQIVYSFRRSSREIEHLGSAHDNAGVELLKAAARQRLAGGQDELDLGLQADADRGAARCRSRLADGAPVGCPGPAATPSWGWSRRLAGTGYSVTWSWRGSSSPPASWMPPVCWRRPVPSASYPTVCRRLRTYARDAWRRQLSAACVTRAGLGPVSLVLYDVSTLYFETVPGTGSASRGSPGNAVWSRRSPSGCSPTRPASR